MATKNTVGAVLINDSPVVTEATVSATSIDTSLPYMNLVGEWYVNGSKVITEATLPSGGGEVSGTIDINANGTYDVAKYAHANVNVPSSGGGDAQATLNALLAGSITDIESNVTTLNQYAFAYQRNLKTVNFPNFISGGTYIFRNCTALTTANFSNAQTIEQSMFHTCNTLKLASFPSATTVRQAAFSSCQRLIKLIVGTNNTTVATLQNTDAFSNCLHILGAVHANNPTGAKDGYIYVPLSLVADYRSATNWATFATQIMPYVATVEELANIDGTTYDKACVGEDYVEYTYNGTSWELYTRS